MYSPPPTTPPHSEKPSADAKPETEHIDHSFTDVESSPGSTVKPEQKLVRQLKNRESLFLESSIGGVIGTGLFLSTANALRFGGPVGLLLGYIFVGTIVYSVMISLGEMISYLPIPGGHLTLAKRFVDPAFSFTMGWNYWYNWTIILPAEISAAAILIDFWTEKVNNAVWMTIVMLVVIGINMCGTLPHYYLVASPSTDFQEQVVSMIPADGALTRPSGFYGEMEFIFASIKVLTITGLIILGIVLDLGGGPSHDRIGFRYWKNPGPFVQYHDIAGVKGRFLGSFSDELGGTEIVAIAAGEAKNPRRNLPKAIRRVYIRILLFYIGKRGGLGSFYFHSPFHTPEVIIIGLLVPSNEEKLNLADGTAASSPFVIAIERAGIKALPSIINACLLTSAWSAGSSDLYTSSRALYGLAVAGNAPRIFSKTLPNGLPIVSLAFCSLFACLAYMGVGSGSGKVFTWLSNMTSVAGLLTWFGICLTYLRFHAGMAAQGFNRKELPFSSPLQPFAAWYALVFTALICLLSGWAVFLKGNFDIATLITNYLPFVMFPILYFGAKLYYWRRGHAFAWRPVHELDFVTDIDQVEADSYDEPPPKNRYEAFWRWLM
ncbi:Lysine-specific permease [Mycena indigotica]|uniref:Lysine-specific permease n=1 Tax=Mycena indigotica TaxID=2126181 RepID=A0A8H6SPC8_9AGAR|nr:Lysine-specific permease [Mycena indigotica]KAF7301525.1 Lysine-specific permease [Mycena indigotica]